MEQFDLKSFIGYL